MYRCFLQMLRKQISNCVPLLNKKSNKRWSKAMKKLKSEQKIGCIVKFQYEFQYAASLWVVTVSDWQMRHRRRELFVVVLLVVLGEAIALFSLLLALSSVPTILYTCSNSKWQCQNNYLPNSISFHSIREPYCVSPPLQNYIISKVHHKVRQL